MGGVGNIIAADVYLLSCVESSWRGRAGPPAGGEDGASQAGANSPVAAQPGRSDRQRLGEVRRSVGSARCRVWAVKSLVRVDSPTFLTTFVLELLFVLKLCTQTATKAGL